MGEKAKRKFGDRKDAGLVKDINAMQAICIHLYPKRTDAEVYLADKIDITDLRINYIL